MKLLIAFLLGVTLAMAFSVYGLEFPPPVKKPPPKEPQGIWVVTNEFQGVTYTCHWSVDGGATPTKPNVQIVQGDDQ